MNPTTSALSRFQPTPARRLRLAALLAGICLAATGRTHETGSPRSLADLAFEDLLDFSVTSVSKKQTTLRNSPAAISVITPEETRRLGITTLAEALRLAPGMNVARINANKWAVSARGFNGQFANKLLVLVDGRAVYTPTFGGVYWDVQDVMMEDLDQIEVIRGPGATLWGANAVNGVINISTKGAKETQGLLVSTAVGTEDRPRVSVRYGGALSPRVFYRVYATHYQRDGLVDPTGAPTPDDWDAFRTGFRLDGEADAVTRFSLIGNYHTGHAGEYKQRASLTPPHSVQFIGNGLNRGANLVARWTRDLGAGSQVSVQTFYDRFDQNVGENLNQESRETFDVEAQHRFPLGSRQDIVWGAGARQSRDDLPSNFGVSWTPGQERSTLLNAFVQDEIVVLPRRLHVILGSKFEHRNFTGFEAQPSARVLWTPAERQTVWAAASRAVRTPSRFERTARVNAAAFRPSPVGPPFLVSLFGNPKLDSEKLSSLEFGYRIDPNRDLTLEAAVFYNRYDDLLGFVAGPSRMEQEPAPAHMLVSPSVMANAGQARTRGVELSGRWRVTSRWSLASTYSLLRMHVRPDVSEEGKSPRHQVQLRSQLDLPGHFDLNAVASYVSGLPAFKIPSYASLDLGVRWRPIQTLECGIWGRNLLDPQRPEMTTNSTSLRTEVPRGIVGRVTWSF
jgi:iron complex outermembrane recepter protein